jgi:hypothetical protein
MARVVLPAANERAGSGTGSSVVAGKGAADNPYKIRGFDTNRYGEISGA